MGWLDGSFVFVFLVVRTSFTRVGGGQAPRRAGGVGQFLPLAALLDLLCWRCRAVLSVDLDHSRAIVCLHSRAIVLSDRVEVGLKSFRLSPFSCLLCGGALIAVISD